MVDDNSAEQVVNIPSFLYLENKIERFQESFDSLINLPESGEAWIESAGKYAKLNILGAGTAPASVRLKGNNVSVMPEPNTFFKDLVFPKLSLRMNVTGLGPDIQRFVYKKYIINDKSIWDSISNYTSLSSLEQALSAYRKNYDWSVYENICDVPIRNMDDEEGFGIIGLINGEKTTGYISASDAQYNSDLTKYIGKRYYDVRLDRTEYPDSIDSTRIKRLYPGMILRTNSGYSKVVLA